MAAENETAFCGLSFYRVSLCRMSWRPSLPTLQTIFLSVFYTKNFKTDCYLTQKDVAVPKWVLVLKYCICLLYKRAFSISSPNLVSTLTLKQQDCSIDIYKRKAYIWHQCSKTTALSCHRCLINTVFFKWTFYYRLELWPPDVCE